MGGARPARADQLGGGRLVPDVRRGEIRWLRFSAPNKRRPVLVLGRDRSLRSWSQIPVIPLSSQIRGLPWEIQISEEEGLKAVSVLKPEWISSVAHTQIGPLITTLAERRWPEVRAALLLALGLAT